MKEGVRFNYKLVGNSPPGFLGLLNNNQGFLATLSKKRKEQIVFLKLALPNASVFQVRIPGNSSKGTFVGIVVIFLSACKIAF